MKKIKLPKPIQTNDNKLHPQHYVKHMDGWMDGWVDD
jgi:hypothetical protein